MKCGPQPHPTTEVTPTISTCLVVLAPFLSSTTIDSTIMTQGRARFSRKEMATPGTSSIMSAGTAELAQPFGESTKTLEPVPTPLTCICGTTHFLVITELLA